MIRELILVATLMAGTAAAAVSAVVNLRESVVAPTNFLRRISQTQSAARSGQGRLIVVGILWSVAMILSRRFIAAALPVVGLAAQRLMSRSVRLRTVKLFEEQFEQAAVTMANSMRTGQSLVQAMAAVEREYGPPLGTEFRRALREYHAGLPLIDAIDGIRSRVPCPEAAFFARALGIHGLTGGNIAGVLGNVSRIIRQRRLLRGEVVAKSGEARLTALVLAALPGLLAGYLYVVDRDMLTPLFTTPLGRAGLVYAVISWVIGVFVINRVASSVGGA